MKGFDEMPIYLSLSCPEASLANWSRFLFEKICTSSSGWPVFLVAIVGWFAGMLLDLFSESNSMLYCRQRLKYFCPIITRVNRIRYWRDFVNTFRTGLTAKSSLFSVEWVFDTYCSALFTNCHPFLSDRYHIQVWVLLESNWCFQHKAIHRFNFSNWRISK